jgi:ribose transport system substrate-binding protein
MRRPLILAAMGGVLLLAACGSSGGNTTSGGSSSQKQLTFGYISPGPDTWYQRDVDGFNFAAQKYGVKTVVLNSQYDAQKEIANIDSLVNQGVDGISMFSFNENGALIAAQKGQQANIPVVLTDDVGHAIGAGAKVAAAVDFDWHGMGVKYAQWMAANYPGEKFAVLAGNFEAPPTQQLDKGMLDTAASLGKNQMVSIQNTKYSPETAVNMTQDLIQSGKQFSILFVMDEDMAAAVARFLQSRNLLNNPIKVIAQNGSPAGITLLKNGDLKYTISSSPGWEGTVAFMALYNQVTGRVNQANTQYMLPVIEVTPQNVDDPTKVVPWQPADVYWTLTKQNFPELVP